LQKYSTYIGRNGCIREWQADFCATVDAILKYARAISKYYVYRNYFILTGNLFLEIPLEIPLDIEIPFSYRKYIYMQDSYD